MANQTLEVIQTRRSIRAYKPGAAVRGDQIAQLVDSALAAPSGNNKQPWLLNVVTNAELLSEFDKAVTETLKTLAPEVYDRIVSRGGTVLYHAPLLILALIPSDSKPYMDAGILVENIAIAAKAIGLDSVILGLPGMVFQGDQAAEWTKKLRIPEGYEFGISIAVGVAEDGAVAREYSPDYSKVNYLE
ncbi:MAG: nitroreductase family protein [Clostridiales bacterium]|jgi:nitroreductase|nr:nitroreductase family protein [Clostridiales bacterium]